MSAVLAKVPQSSIANKPIQVSYIAKGKDFNLRETLTSRKTKDLVNYVVNGSAAASGLLAFVNGNFSLSDSLHRFLEPLSEGLIRAGTATSGLLGAIDLWQKKNLFSFLGYSLMVPLGSLVKGYNLWLARGVSSGLTNFVLITDRRELVDSKGEAIKDKTGKVQYINGDFSENGWWGSVQVTAKESLMMLKEVYNKPSRIAKFSHAVLISSLLQIISPFISFLGLKNTGAGIRNVSGVGSFASMLFDKKSSNGKKGINLKSPIVQCGLLRIGTSIVDLMKRFDFISSRVNNLTDVSLALDRLASIRFATSVFDIKKGK